MLERFTRLLPAFGHCASHFGQAGGNARDGVLEFRDAAPLAVLIRLALDVKEFQHGVGAKQIAQFLAVDIGLALAGTAVRGHHQDLGVRLAMLDQPDPFLDKALLGTFARLPDHEINRGRAEEQLMRGAIDTLAAKVPAVERDLCATVRVGDLDRLDFNPMGGGVLPAMESPRSASNRQLLPTSPSPTRMSLASLSTHLRFGFGAQVGFDGFETFVVGRSKFGVKRV